MLYDSGLYKEAIKTSFKISKKAWAYPGCPRLVGLCLFKLGEYHSAIDIFNVGLKENPTSTIFFRDRAEVNMALGQFQNAISDYNRYLKEHPGDEFSIMETARALVEIDEPDSAMKLLTDHEFPYSSIYTVVGVHYWSVRQDRENALKAWKISIDLDSTNVSSYSMMGFMEWQSGEIDRAFQAFEALIKNNPENAEGYYLLGLLQEEQGFEEDAAENYRIAREKGYVENDDEEAFLDEDY